MWMPAKLEHTSSLTYQKTEQVKRTLKRGTSLGQARHKRPKTNRSELRNKLCEAQNWRCCYCGGTMANYHEETQSDDAPIKFPTIEHVIPLSWGGDNCWENLVGACYDCNDERGNKYTAEEFYLKKQLQLLNLLRRTSR